MLEEEIGATRERKAYISPLEPRSSAKSISKIPHFKPSRKGKTHRYRMLITSSR
jgi:hypothetical protein